MLSVTEECFGYFYFPLTLASGTSKFSELWPYPKATCSHWHVPNFSSGKVSRHFSGWKVVRARLYICCSESLIIWIVKHSSLFLFLLHHSSPYFFLECFPSTLMHTHKNVVFCFHLCLGELCISYVVTYHGYPGSHLNLSLWCLLNIYLLEYSQVPQFQLNKCLCPFHVCILKLHTLSQYILSVNGSLIHLTA